MSFSGRFRRIWVCQISLIRCSVAACPGRRNLYRYVCGSNRMSRQALPIEFRQSVLISSTSVCFRQSSLKLSTYRFSQSDPGTLCLRTESFMQLQPTLGILCCLHRPGIIGWGCRLSGSSFLQHGICSMMVISDHDEWPRQDSAVLLISWSIRQSGFEPVQWRRILAGTALVLRCPRKNSMWNSEPGGCLVCR